MTRLHDRLFRLTDDIDRLREEERRTAAELDVLLHLDDDARRDAAVGGPIEREDARMTAADVARFRRALRLLAAKRERLEWKRERLLQRLGPPDP
ncbi:MAG: hypothetical protein KQH83_01895 [Actinobacteria bacterium]|nr:hypothetical protein [Actinomycetota bacterium]